MSGRHTRVLCSSGRIHLTGNRRPSLKTDAAAAIELYIEQNRWRLDERGSMNFPSIQIGRKASYSKSFVKIIAARMSCRSRANGTMMIGGTRAQHTGSMPTSSDGAQHRVPSSETVDSI